MYTEPVSTSPSTYIHCLNWFQVDLLATCAELLANICWPLTDTYLVLSSPTIIFQFGEFFVESSGNQKLFVAEKDSVEIIGTHVIACYSKK